MALIAPVVQFEKRTIRNTSKGEQFDRQHPDWVRGDDGPARPKDHKGAIGRWRRAVHQFWEGRNIYHTVTPRSVTSGGDDTRRGAGVVRLHPNMPLVVIGLTPLMYLPVWAMALGLNVLKLVLFAGAVWMALRLANHREHRMGDWVAALAVLWAVKFIIGDIQHGNTNTIVLAVIVLHLWLYRRGKDLAAGAALALSICMKMTPALFVLYWLYQRNWKLLAAVVVAMVVFVAIVPAAVLGPARSMELTGTWLDNLIVPGLMKGGEYPIHVNQSLPAVLSRYLLEGRPGGNIYWNPDDNPYATQSKFAWIAPVSLDPATVKWIVRLCQVSIAAVMAWAVGWRRLPRCDGRRMLHYGLIVLGMLLLNQRTWNHHAGVLLIATGGIWYALAYGLVSLRVRAVALGAMVGGAAVYWLSSDDIVKSAARLMGYDRAGAGAAADVVEAYGPTFVCFVLWFTAAVMLSVALRKADPPYANVRQKLRTANRMSHKDHQESVLSG